MRDYRHCDFFGRISLVQILKKKFRMHIFRLSLTSEKITFDYNLELKFQISQDLKKCFKYDLRKKLAS
jgi:hypothetical protein